MKVRFLLAAVVLAAPTLSAQQSFVGITGNIYRYHGDTIWMERDTTLTRTITHGDTIVTETRMNDQLKSRMTQVIHGDSALLVEYTDASGNTTRPMRNMPAIVAGLVQRGLEMEMRTSQMGVGRGGAMRRFEPPLRPDTVARYQVSPRRLIVQSRDTVRIINGCLSDRQDTTTFILFGADSARRVSMPQRTFGPSMAQALIADMRGVLLHEGVTAMRSPLPNDFPKPPNPCG